MDSVKMRCIVIDDELHARSLIEMYIAKIPFLELVGTFESSTEALFEFKMLKPNLIFLDIEMPGISGIQFLHFLPIARPAVIMVTGDPTYALEGFEHQVADYLLKPVSFERFLKAVSKVLNVSPLFINNQLEHSVVLPSASEKMSESKTGILEIVEGSTGFLLLKENKKFIKVASNDIHLIEGMRDYLKLYLLGRIAVIHMTMAKMEKILSPDVFLRVSRSHIVNKKIIIEIEKNQINTILGKKITIGVTYRNGIVAALKRERTK